MYSRLHRAMLQRILMLEEVVDIEKVMGDYKILGSTENIYNVHIDANRRSCSCPDHMKRLGDCKHILFVLVQILKFRHSDENVSQITKRGLKAKLLKRLNAKVINTIQPQEKKEDSKVAQKPLFDADCPICLEPFLPDETVLYCKMTCGNNIHQVCMLRWFASSKSSSPPSCPMCRGPWLLDG